MRGIPIGIAISTGSLAAAQDTGLQEHVTGAVSVLEQLDALAATCMTALQQAEDTDTATPCSQFLAAIDGEMLARYLAHCAVLKEWKTHYVTAAFNADQSSTTPDNALQLLVGTDYACGDDALQQRTQFVTSTFALLQQGAGISQRQNTQLDQRLKELQFDASLTSERNLLQNSVQQQELQRAQESARQMRQIELENLRQQLDQ